ncbi:hypothetical protein DICPUDRAFT_98085 [Dictyostelium purpureum]|uniref:Uncharacterized protein n=1 Tax=Dictyostelium purpureum TaxID=5786 RepID=F0ZMK8_DICPU|nr:uncharacterized protein DICPUDRAFT_98085 [Dictyostelium purpureum]EGC34808.1 hypothetical protein DICPUDRAFT_98085 [Dictyostelium purpureum]|eukprot:XP_003288665.1 hypothetical protein DICPUDRAFT_98085 [Dictyostelium purpureum]
MSLNTDSNNNSKLPNYIIKPILYNYINKATSNVLVFETIYIISQVCKEWRENILPKLVFKKFKIYTENSFYQLFFIMTRFNIDFQSISMDLEFWPNIRKYLIDNNSDSGIDDEIKFIDLDDNCNKELKKYFYQNKEKRKGFLNVFTDKVCSANLLCYYFQGYELLEFKNLKKIIIFIDDEYPIQSFIKALSSIFEKEGDNREWVNKTLKNIQIYSDDNIDFSDSVLKKFFKGLKSIEALIFSSHTTVSLRNIVKLLDHQSGNNNFKRLSFKNCSIPREELYQLYERNQTIESLKLGGMLENGAYNDAIIPLSGDSKIKEFSLFNDYPTILNFSIIANVLNCNKVLSGFSIYTIVSDDTNEMDSVGTDGDDNDIVIKNETLAYLSLLSKTDRIIFEKGQFNNLKGLKCSISEKMIRNLSMNNKESLENLFVFDSIDSSLETKKNFELLTSGSDDGSGGYLGQFKNLKTFEISLEERSSVVNWEPLFKSVTSPFIFLNELSISSLTHIQESLISDFFLSNHPTIKKIRLSLRYTVKDWSLVLDPICRNKTLTSVHINSNLLNGSNYNCTRSFIDIIQQNNSLEALTISIRDSLQYTQLDLKDLSSAILSNSSLKYLQFPYNLNKNPLIFNSIKYKIIKTNYHFN